MLKVSKKILSVLMVILLVTTAVPMSGFAGFELSALDCGIEASDITESDNDTEVDDVDHNYQIVDSLEPDCNKDGYVTYECSDDDCDEGYTDIIPALGHEYGEWIVIKEPDCKERGMMMSACIRCEAANAKYLDKSAHTVAVYDGTEPTCENTGLTEGSYCTVCGEILEEQLEIPATGHQTETVVGTPADCINSGLTDGQKCIVCGEVTVEPQQIPALGHDIVIDAIKSYDATCLENGIKHLSCSRCSYYEEVDIPALGHNFTDWAIENKFETRKCLTCGVVETRTIENCSHEAELVKGLPASCTTTGISDGFICSICGVMIEEQLKLPALGHTDSDADGICDREECNYDLTADCRCNCHKGGLLKSMFNFMLFFQKLFRLNRTCKCGIAHY